MFIRNVFNSQKLETHQIFANEFILSSEWTCYVAQETILNSVMTYQGKESEKYMHVCVHNCITLLYI